MEMETKTVRKNNHTLLKKKKNRIVSNLNTR